jgi:hypothetical protein
MAEANWSRLKESDIKEYGGMLPARVVLEYNESDHPYRTFLETITKEGECGFQYGRYFYWEEEALANFNQRLGRL